MRRGFGEKGKLLVREKFNWSKIAEQIENVYKDILKVLLPKDEGQG
ncbi:hypothetical protein M1N22_01945 [Dehalococcoidia bacterium]|nr:hypothetical protein [Dehalococcoidia bacterium]